MSECVYVNVCWNMYMYVSVFKNFFSMCERLFEHLYVCVSII